MQQGLTTLFYYDSRDIVGICGNVFFVFVWLAMVKVGGIKVPYLKPKKYINKETLYILSDSDFYQRNQKRRGGVKEEMVKRKRVAEDSNSKRWQKAIVGLLMAAIMIGSVIALFSL